MREYQSFNIKISFELADKLNEHSMQGWLVDFIYVEPNSNYAFVLLSRAR